MRQVLLILGLCLGLSACKKEPQEPPGSPGAEGKIDEFKSVSLEINGFNYTDLYIENFSVAGVGGGNVFVSSLDSGGGGSTCCMRWYPGVTLPFPVKIVWTRDGKRICEKEVLINGPVPEHPRHVVVQFLQDGRIEIELTEDFPDVKLRLERFSPVERKKSGNSVLDEQIARCHDAFPR
ncbi:DUF3304 domain-containing protein [Cystobacter fuscus]